MSNDWGLISISIGLLAIAAVLAAGSIWLLLKQKVIYDQQRQRIDIDVPFVGKLKTNSPAIAVAFISLFPSYAVFKLWDPPPLVKVHGTIVVPKSMAETVTVGVTSPVWTTPGTPNQTGELQVDIPVPESWPSYSAYAYVLNGSESVRPAFAGVDWHKHTFELELHP